MRATNGPRNRLRLGQRRLATSPGTPFGGVKDSGVGREKGVEELYSYTQSKKVYVRFAVAGQAPISSGDYDGIIIGSGQHGLILGSYLSKPGSRSRFWNGA